MTELTVTFRENLWQFVPGQIMRGIARWQLDEPSNSLDLHLFWYTEGKGTQDVSRVATIQIEKPLVRDERPFEFQLPQAPYSFSGKLISLIWAVELIARPGNQSTRLPFTLSPTGEEIVLMSADK